MLFDEFLHLVGEGYRLTRAAVDDARYLSLSNGSAYLVGKPLNGDKVILLY